MVQKEQRLYLKIANKSDWVIMEDVLSLLVRTKRSYAENICKQLEPRTGQTICQVGPESNLLDTL